MGIIRPGELRTKLVLQEKQTASNGQGGTRITGWQDVSSTIRAKMEVIRSTEAVISGVERSSTLYRITIRYRDGVTPKHRFRWDGDPLNIVSSGDPDGTREALLITAETVPA